METLLLIIASLITIAGIIGNVLPVLPGTPLNYAALLILHFARGGEVFSMGFLLVIGGLTIASVALDYVMPVIGARAYGASRHSMWGSVIGMLMGLVVFSFPGMFIGMFLGAVVGELISGKKGGEAFKAGFASFLGSLAASMLKLGLSVVMAVYFFANLAG
jgi:uncharacterized protein YqgC (DUF456 family)